MWYIFSYTYWLCVYYFTNHLSIFLMGYCFINELHEFLYILDKMLPLQMCLPAWCIFFFYFYSRTDFNFTKVFFFFPFMMSAIWVPAKKFASPLRHEDILLHFFQKLPSFSWYARYTIHLILTFVNGMSKDWVFPFFFSTQESLLSLQEKVKPGCSALKASSK